MKLRPPTSQFVVAPIALASGHAKLSPSGAYRWSTCTAAPSEEAGIVDRSSEAAMWGTAAHLISGVCLETGAEPAAFHGRTVAFLEPRGEKFEDELLGDETVIHRIVPDDEMIDCCERYVDFVRELVASLNAILMVEQRVYIGWITGEDGAAGTSDCVIFAGRELIIVDLKGGMGQVDAYVQVGMDVITGMPLVDPNSQMAMYAGGALRQFDWMGPFDRVRMIIVQPRLSHVSEHSMSTDDLLAFLQRLSVAAEETRTNPVHRPSQDTCHFCKAKAANSCKALNQWVYDTAVGDFTDLSLAPMRVVPDPELGVVYEKLDLIESWCNTVRARVRAELEQGRAVIGDRGPYKLVEGRLGNRAWGNEQRAEKLAVVFVGDAAHTRKFKSPAQVEKLLAKKHPKQWQVIQEHIAPQTRTASTIVPVADPRPALASAMDGFTDQSQS